LGAAWFCIAPGADIGSSPHSVVQEEALAKLTRKHPIDFDLDRAMKTRLSAPEIINALAAWLPGQPSLDGLRVSNKVVLHVGERTDVYLLRLWHGSDQTALADALADTRFAVARRTA